MLEALVEIDRSLFLRLNGWRTAALDLPMFFVSQAWCWIPVFLLLLYVLSRGFPTAAERLVIVVGIVVCLSGTDLISAKLMKPNVRRFRPSYDQTIASQTHTVRRPGGGKYHGGRFGFPSSHAANFFGLATFGSLLLGRRWAPWLFGWAALVGYSRIYLGVHFPGDVVGGLVIGAVWASLVYYWMQARLALARRRSTAPPIVQGEPVPDPVNGAPALPAPSRRSVAR